jgi:hypothetical protein
MSSRVETRLTETAADGLKGVGLALLRSVVHMHIVISPAQTVSS